MGSRGSPLRARSQSARSSSRCNTAAGKVTDIQDQCLGAKVPFFFKQWGGVQKKRAGRSLEGRTWDEMPISMNLVKV